MPSLPDHIYAVILAGGSGTRFWPKSRHNLPKQLCKIGDSDRSMIELTLQRLDGLIPPSRRIIVTHKDQLASTKEIVGAQCQHFLAEPVAKNTAPALTLAALEIRQLHMHSGGPEPVMISLHADALVTDVESFRSALQQMAQVASEKFLTLLGIKPEYPETGYGYIEKGAGLSDFRETAKVRSFREKPDLKTAEEYLSSGRFLWNSGIFAWRIDVILEELERYFPLATQTLAPLLAEGKFSSFNLVNTLELEDAYSSLPSLAIDPAVLERSQRVAVCEADIGWKDVGSWDALDQCFATDTQGNFIVGDAIHVDCEGLTIDTDGPLVACLGLQDIVVVHAHGAILVCPKDRAQDVRKIVEKLKTEGRAAFI